MKNKIKCQSSHNPQLKCWVSSIASLKLLTEQVLSLAGPVNTVPANKLMCICTCSQQPGHQIARSPQLLKQTYLQNLRSPHSVVIKEILDIVLITSFQKKPQNFLELKSTCTEFLRLVNLIAFLIIRENFLYQKWSQLKNHVILMVLKLKVIKTSQRLKKRLFQTNKTVTQKFARVKMASYLEVMLTLLVRKTLNPQEKS